MTDDRNLEAPLFQQARHLPRDHRFSAAGPDSTDGHDRHPALDHRLIRTEEDEIRPLRKDEGGLVHQLLVGNIAVTKNDLIHTVLRNQTGQFLLEINGNPLRVVGTCELREDRSGCAMKGICVAVKATTS